MTTREREIWDEIYREEKEADDFSKKDCKGTNRTGNVQWHGTLEHWMIMIDFLAGNPLGAEVEYQIPGASGNIPGKKGYADLVNTFTNEIFEIKPDNDDGLKAGKAEVKEYVLKANVNCKPQVEDPGLLSPWREGTGYATRTLPNPRNPLENLNVRLATNGVVVYKSVSRTTEPLPIVIPKTVLDQLKNLLKKLKEKITDYETVIGQYLRENPELVQYIKGAAFTAAIAIIVGTIVEDFLTAGAGIADDWASFSLAYRIVRFASKL